MTTLVNVDVDTASKLVQYISQLGNEDVIDTAFCAECQTLIDKHDINGLIVKLMSKQSTIFAIDDTIEIENIFAILVSILLTDGESNNIGCFTTIVSIIVSSTSVNTIGRLKALLIVYGLTCNGQLKYSVFISCLKYALSTNQTKCVVSFHSQIDAWIVSWNLSTAEKQVLYTLFAHILQADGLTSQSIHMKICYLNTYDGKVLPADAVAVAIDMVTHAILSPIAAFDDRNLILECITQQQEVDELGSLVSLLRIMCTGTIETYDAYANKHGTIMKKYNICTTELSTAMKLITLCSLAAANQTISFKTIADALKLSIDDVESYVVDAIAQGLLEANMDQSTGTLTVHRCVHRSFTADNWNQLQTKLHAVSKNILTLLDSLKKQ